jgi:hypothetical protein
VSHRDDADVILQLEEYESVGKANHQGPADLEVLRHIREAGERGWTLPDLR